MPQVELPHVDKWYACIRNRDAARGVLDISLS
jgi:hypothetical protein